MHNTYTEPLIDGLLYQYANNNPSGFNEKFTSSSRSVNEIFQTAIVLGIISHVPDQGYKFENYKLGAVEFDVIAILNKDKTILSAVLDQIAKVDMVIGDIESRTKRIEDLTNANQPIKEKINEKVEKKEVAEVTGDEDNKWS